MVASRQGDFAAARTFYEEGLSIGRELADERAIGTILNSSAELARAEGNYAAARPLYQEALSLHRKRGDKEGVSISLCNLAAVAYRYGDLEAAGSQYAEALAAALQLGNKIDISISLDGLAAIKVTRGQMERAAQLAGAADRLRRSIGYELENVDRLFRDAYVSLLRDALSADAFAYAYEQGRLLTMNEASALALERVG